MCDYIEEETDSLYTVLQIENIDFKSLVNFYAVKNKTKLLNYKFAVDMLFPIYKPLYVEFPKKMKDRYKVYEAIMNDCMKATGYNLTKITSILYEIP
jgi:hypothetical protein